MELDCPHCNKTNKLNFQDASIACGECSKPLDGLRFTTQQAPEKSRKKSISGFVFAVVLGGLGYKNIDEHIIGDARYPLSIEYAILDSCVNSYTAAMTKTAYAEKKKICTCTLEQTMLSYGYKSFQEDQNGFVRAFKSNVATCER